MSQDPKDTSNPDFIIDDINLADGTPGWDGSKGPSLAAGDYEVVVIGAAVEPTNNGSGRQLVLDLQVTSEGDFAGAACKHWITLPSANHKDGGAGAKKRVAHVVRDVLGAPLLPNGGFEGRALIGRGMTINVNHEVSSTTAFDPASNANVTTEKTRMVISQERPLAGAAPVATPAPAAQQQARPAGAQPASPPRRPPAAAPAPRRS